jgi:hypothetical protein
MKRPAEQELLMDDQSPRPLTMMRKGKLEDLDRSFDLVFWQAQDDTARFAAAWELVVFAQRLKTKDGGQPRLQRSVEALQRIPD